MVVHLHVYMMLLFAIINFDDDEDKTVGVVGDEAVTTQEE